MYYRPSFKRTPSEPVLLARSDPARSTKWSFAERYSSPISSSEESLMGEPEWSLRICCSVIVKMACDRLIQAKKEPQVIRLKRLNIMVTI